MRRSGLLGDVALATIVTILGQVELAAASTEGSLLGLRAGAAIATMTLSLRRVAPAIAFGLAACGLVVMERAGTTSATLPFLTFLFLAGNAGWRSTTRAGLLVIGVVSAGAMVTDLAQGTGLGDIVVNLLIVVAAWVGPHLIRGATDRRIAVEVAAERDVRKAVEQERIRIARDLHDSIAHAVSVMTLQAGAARQSLVDPAATEASLMAIERSGRAAMEDLHRFLGLLKADRELETPSLADVDQLLDGLRATGCHVEASIAPEQDASLAAQTTAFRVLQESVTNALKHQELERVDIEVGSDPLTVRVTSLGAFRMGVGTGSGLPGLRDRVEAFGGSFTAAAVGPATWMVRAALPGQTGA
jgi:signal transduction histidine kinase